MTGTITLKLKLNGYQPGKAGLEAGIPLDAPGETLEERADALAGAVMRTVEIEHEDAS